MKKTPETINAVIYARYSSHNQTEQSIEGQLHDNYAYAERCGYNVIGEYIDRAMTGTKDDRPDFQRMIKDAEKRQFQTVIVWKLDRFARNRYDSAVYKRILKKYGVRVVSVMENITDSPEGIILEGLLESMAEYYSANLAENVRRGIQASIAKGYFCGGPVPLGYKVQDHKLVEDERYSPLVREIIQRYADGEEIASIVSNLNERGYRTPRGTPFSGTSFHRTLYNPAYIGEYTYNGQIVPGVSVPLVSKEVFSRALQRRAENRRAPAADRSESRYLLSGKIFCGLCGSTIVGNLRRSSSGKKYFYYRCSGRKMQKSSCPKNTEQKDFIEWYVCEQTVQYVLDPDRMESIADAVVDLYNSEFDDSRLHELERTSRRLESELNALVDNLVYATTPEVSARICDKMRILEQQLSETETDLSKIRIQNQIKLTKKEVIAWLKTFTKGDLFDMDFREKIIDTFINSVYLWDDKVVIFYNLRGGKQVSAIEVIQEFEEESAPPESLSLEANGDPLGSKDKHPDHAFVIIRGMLGLVVYRNKKEPEA